jgi:hypothetical protein
MIAAAPRLFSQNNYLIYHPVKMADAMGREQADRRSGAGSKMGGAVGRKQGGRRDGIGTKRGGVLDRGHGLRV